MGNMYVCYMHAIMTSLRKKNETSKVSSEKKGLGLDSTIN